ncbi:MAG TPA: Hpt domain-containing protein [Pirellulales bacterium]|nr:Hpt domain-containing protein [Pirellulales bacterium]
MDEERLMDIEAALWRLGGDRSLLGDVIQFYMEDAPGLLDQVRRGVESRSAQEIERAAHSLKGLSASFSADRAVNAARRLETIGRTNDLATAPDACKTLEIEVTALMNALRELQKSDSTDGNGR